MPTHRIVVVAEHSEDGARMARSLLRLGIQPVAATSRAVVIARNVLSEELGRINHWMRKRRSSWILVKAGGPESWLGPLFVPRRTGCWQCLAHRLRENGWKDHVGVRLRPAVFEDAAREIRRWMDGESRLGEGTILTLGCSPAARVVHTFRRLAQCPVCGSPAASSPKIHLQSRIKLPAAQRVCSPAEVIARLTPLVDELTGIIVLSGRQSRWKSYPVSLAWHNRPLPTGAPQPPVRAPRQPVAGKGHTPEESHAGSLAEAVERYSIQWHGREALRQARESELPDAIGLPRLALWSDEQLQQRERWNREVSGFHRIPQPWPGDPELEWIALWSLTARRRRYVPAGYCYLYYPNSPYAADSNGCAAGSVLEEAILQGFLELVERDAIGIWWYNRLERPSLRLEGPLSRRYAKVKRELADRGRTLALLNLTADFEIPVVVAVSALENGKGILLGTGAHLDPATAVNRALAELCQVVEVLGSRAKPHGRLTAVETVIRRWLRDENLRDHPYLTPQGKPARLGDLPDHSKPDLKAEIDWCVGRARALGLEVLVLDLTRSDLNFPVARVIVPGIRHCWGRFAPGRLYDVPVRMGWRTHPLRESELNPIP